MKHPDSKKIHEAGRRRKRHTIISLVLALLAPAGPGHSAETPGDGATAGPGQPAERRAASQGLSPEPAKAARAESSAGEIQQLRAQLAEQARRIDRLYFLLGPEMEELEEHANRIKERDDDLAKDASLRLKTVCRLTHQDFTSRAQFSPRDNAFAVIRRRGDVQIYSTEGKCLHELSAPGTKVNAIAYAPDGRRLLAGTKDGRVLLWDIATGATRTVFTNIAGMVGRVAWLANPERGVATSDLMTDTTKPEKQAGYVFRLTDGEVLATFSGMVRNDFQQLAVSPDGRWLGVLEIPNRERAGFLLEANSGRMRSTLYDEEYGSGPLSIGMAPDNNTVALGYAPYHISLWDGAQQRQLRRLKAHSNWVTALGFSPDSRRLISGGGDSTCRIWEVETGKEIGRIRFEGNSTYVNSVSFSPDGTMILAAGENDTLVIAQAPK